MLGIKLLDTIKKTCVFHYLYFITNLFMIYNITLVSVICSTCLVLKKFYQLNTFDEAF